MTTVREGVALRGYTTLRLGGPAARFIDADSDAEIIAAVRAADRRGDPVLVLGGGSNVVVADEGFPGTVVHIASRGITASAVGDGTSVAVAAGEEWDPLVAWCAGEQLTGLECLSGIPGLAGAAPIQNVGAYGQEVAQTITGVRAYDRRREAVVDLSRADCGFGYRTSAFKQASAPTGRFVVLGVTFALTRSPLSAPLAYAELAGRLGVAAGTRLPLDQVRQAVLALRRGKGMVLDPQDVDSRSAGSFFTNPVLDRSQFAVLEKAARAALGDDVRVPSFAAGDGAVKVPAAWLIERAGFRKGYPGPGGSGGAAPGGGNDGHADQGAGPRISSRHTLALVNPGGASAAGLLGLARQIRTGVRERFGVELACEPVLVGMTL